MAARLPLPFVPAMWMHCSSFSGFPRWSHQVLHPGQTGCAAAPCAAGRAGLQLPVGSSFFVLLVVVILVGFGAVQLCLVGTVGGAAGQPLMLAAAQLLTLGAQGAVLAA